MSLFPQDPAEAFLLAQVPSASVAGPSTYGKRQPPTDLVPPSLSLKSRRLSKSRRSSEVVRRADEVLSHSASGLLSRQDEEAVEDEDEEEDESRRRIPSPEEHRVWTQRRQSARQAQLDSSRPMVPSSYSSRTNGSQWHASNLNLNPNPNPTGEIALDKLGKEIPGDESDEGEAGEMCVICLQAVNDRTIVGDCDHSIFCFDCINVWSNQSRKCPLCTAPMREYLLHDLERRTGPVKFYLPPLPTINPNNPPSTTFASSLPHRRPVPPFRRRGPDVLYPERDLWARTRVGRGEDPEGEEVLERMVAVRREVYRGRKFAKHLGSNVHTRYRPLPTPRQFAENPEYTTRATMWLRRELRVWRDLDVEFLTTYIISLMRSIDIRSEPAVRLLSDFLDVRGSEGRERQGTEHFVHEFVAFLRSPYRDLAVYDAVVQYDPVSTDELEDEDDDDFFAQRMRAGPSRERQGSIKIDEREEFAGDVVLDETDLRQIDELAQDELHEDGARSPSRRGRSRSISSDGSLGSLSSAGSIDRRPIDRRRKPSPSSPRRWDRVDNWVAPPSKLDRRWDQADSWVDIEMLKEVEEERRVEREKRAKARPDPIRNGMSLSSVGKPNDVRADELLPESHDRVGAQKVDVAQRGMRGWGEPGDADEEAVLTDTSAVPVDTVQSAKQPLVLRIFGTGGINDTIPTVETHRDRTPEQEEVELDDVLSEEEDAMLDAQVWGTEDAIDLDLLAEKRNKRRASQAATKPRPEIVPTARQEAAVSQARQAIIDNNKRRAEKKEQLLAKLIRAKMQLRHRPREMSPSVPRYDKAYAASYESEPEDSEQQIQPVVSVPEAIDTRIPNSEAIEAEARARAKAKLRMRLLQEKKKQQQQSSLLPSQIQDASAVLTTQSEPVAEDRTAMLREKLLKARQQKQAVSTA